MRELPIIFTRHSVDAIFEGRKTNTRRVVKPQPPYGYFFHGFIEESTNKNLRRNDLLFGNSQHIPSSNLHMHARPRYQVGNLLWVKETHYKYGCFHQIGDTKKSKFYQMSVDHNFDFDVPAVLATSRFEEGWHKRSPLYMEKKYARLWLKVTGMKVERLQKISEEDAIAEGMFFTDYGKECFHSLPCSLPKEHEYHQQLPGWSNVKTSRHTECMGSARYAFFRLWNDINTKPGTCYDDNPFVIAYEFERIER